ncbi:MULTISPECIES: hypothetical protein [unclassified Kitasatospora]|uniref:hypothetical protein n=1 Tax=unclassified Kitasatospora TaxID=2633591 RepID=UPI0007107517|nr:MULTISPECIES: hypothetical protein [unclassified Kitasatospora]KQV21732.1 hypothetical protein ASC99_18715 [Kitasatospora sp. Root107]KRB75475.1 hypothetical protein ASE03_16040 [Kitasatospora sp. Root187]
MDESTARGMRYLLGLAGASGGPWICTRLGIAPEGPVGPEVKDGNSVAWAVRTVPQVRVWMLQQDDSEANRMLCRMGLLSAGVTEDVRSGLLFGPGRQEAVPAGPTQRSELPVTSGLIRRLRKAEGRGALADARAAAEELRRADWPLVAAAHREHPYPGYARWALAEQVDCPAELRAEFGTHPKFEHRLRQAGLTGALVDCLTTSTARDALRVLGLGRVAFRARLAESEDILRPLVERELGGNEAAWAVLAELLPSFAGTLSELITTAAAIASPGPEPAPERRPVAEPMEVPLPVSPAPVEHTVRRRPVPPAPVEPSFWKVLTSFLRRITGSPTAAAPAPERRQAVRTPVVRRPVIELGEIAADPEGWEDRLRRAAAHPGEGGDDIRAVHQALTVARLDQLRRCRRVALRLVVWLPPKQRASFLVRVSVERQRFWIALFAKLPR